MSQASRRQPGQQTRLVPLVATCLVILGMLNIPVECGLAAGPHSMFLSPETVAGLQGQASHGNAGTSHTSQDRAHDDGEDPQVVSGAHAPEDMEVAMQDVPGVSSTQPHPSMPTPAGFASDSIPLLVIASPMAGPRYLGPPLRVSFWTAPLLDHEATGPEPPPPNLG